MACGIPWVPQRRARNRAGSSRQCRAIEALRSLSSRHVAWKRQRESVKQRTVGTAERAWARAGQRRLDDGDVQANHSAAGVAWVSPLVICCAPACLPTAHALCCCIHRTHNTRNSNYASSDNNNPACPRCHPPAPRHPHALRRCTTTRPSCSLLPLSATTPGLSLDSSPTRIVRRDSFLDLIQVSRPPDSRPLTSLLRTHNPISTPVAAPVVIDVPTSLRASSRLPRRSAASNQAPAPTPAVLTHRLRTGKLTTSATHHHGHGSLPRDGSRLAC